MLIQILTDILFLLGIPGGLSFLVILGILFIPGLLWIWALINCLMNEFEGDNKLIWLLVIIFLPFIGSIIYLLIGRGQQIKR
ncbi:PLD nuclease N-terminal domain-containing protein [Fulvivirga sp.]|uniref:PLD nuclease N-terminal domain-containing protein n=1 Tax=Fulvivirga sp. TaxID=1931237 RepID=UPI0032ED42D5